MSQIWQEADCPNGADWDLTGDEMVHAGLRIRCIWCGEEHDPEIAETYATDDEGAFRVLAMPANAEELAALRRTFE